MRVSERTFIRHVQNRKIGKTNNFKIFGTMKTKGPNQYTKVSFEWEISLGLIKHKNTDGNIYFHNQNITDCSDQK
jgi:hypothetical protein